MGFDQPDSLPLKKYHKQTWQQVVHECLSAAETSSWMTEMETMSTLSLYRVLKRGRRFLFEDYLDWTSRDRRLWLQFRAGVSGLKVDTQRGQPRDRKLCDLCEGLEPEDETHLLLRCAVEAGPRAELLARLPGFQDLCAEARLLTLFGVDTSANDRNEGEARRRRTLAFIRQAKRRRDDDRRGERPIQRELDILSAKYLHV